MKLSTIVSKVKAKTRLLKLKTLRTHTDGSENTDEPVKRAARRPPKFSLRKAGTDGLDDMLAALADLAFVHQVDDDAVVSRSESPSPPAAPVDTIAPQPASPVLSGTTLCSVRKQAPEPSSPDVQPEPVREQIPELDSPDTQADHDCDPAFARFLQIEDFDYVRLLGAGGFGSVHLVYDKVTCRYFALKVIKKKRLSVKSYPRIFEEQRIGKELARSEWAVGVEGSWDDYDNFYILLEYCAGGDLSDRIRKHGPLGRELAKRTAAELVVALDDLHGRGIMHRDIKLGNVIIAADGHLKLADFGLSKADGVPDSARAWQRMPAFGGFRVPKEAGPAAADARHPDIAGTPGFLAPEMYTGAEYTYACDVFSLGVVFYKLIFDCAPFGIDRARMSRTEIAERVRTLPVEFPHQAGPRTRDLLARMLAKDPKERITLAAVKAHPYFHACRFEAIARRPPSQKLQDGLFRGVAPHMIPKSRIGALPAGTPYARGASPFPWLTYAGPALSDTSRPQPPPRAPAEVVRETAPPAMYYKKRRNTARPGVAAAIKNIRTWGGLVLVPRPRVEVLVR